MPDNAKEPRTASTGGNKYKGVDSQVWRETRVYALRHGISTQDIVTQALRQFLKLDDPEPTTSEQGE